MAAAYRTPAATKDVGGHTEARPAVWTGRVHSPAHSDFARRDPLPSTPRRRGDAPGTPPRSPEDPACSGRHAPGRTAEPDRPGRTPEAARATCRNRLLPVGMPYCRATRTMVPPRRQNRAVGCRPSARPASRGRPAVGEFYTWPATACKPPQQSVKRLSNTPPINSRLVHVPALAGDPGIPVAFN